MCPAANGRSLAGLQAKAGQGEEGEPTPVHIQG